MTFYELLEIFRGQVVGSVIRHMVVEGFEVSVRGGEAGELDYEVVVYFTTRSTDEDFDGFHECPECGDIKLLGPGPKAFWASIECDSFETLTNILVYPELQEWIMADEKETIEQEE